MARPETCFEAVFIHKIDGFLNLNQVTFTENASKTETFSCSHCSQSLRHVTMSLTLQSCDRAVSISKKTQSEVFTSELLMEIPKPLKMT